MGSIAGHDIIFILAHGGVVQPKATEYVLRKAHTYIYTVATCSFGRSIA
jgi:hypothetical protein